MLGWGLLADVLFGGIGFVAFVYGRKMGQWKPAVIGALLMCYPYFVPGVVLLYVVGAALTAALFYFRD
jgi:hypothetical protein